jgi:hypothetical protein
MLVWENRQLFCPKSTLHSQNSPMSVPLTTHTLTTYHQHSLFIIHTLTKVSAHYHSHIHPFQPYVSFKYSSMWVSITTHTLIHVSHFYLSQTHHLSLTHSPMPVPLTTHTLTIYHSHTHPCQSHLPLTHSQFTTHTHPCQSHLPLTHNLPLIHSPMSVPVNTHTHTHSSMSALLTSHTLTTYHSHTYLCQPHLTFTQLPMSAPFITDTLICGKWRPVVRWVCIGLSGKSSAFTSMEFMGWRQRQFSLWH